MLQEIVRAVASNQVLVISGETGCGKTTQVPQFILDDFIERGCASRCRIICTQPRRISAISVRGWCSCVGYYALIIIIISSSSSSNWLVFCTCIGCWTCIWREIWGVWFRAQLRLSDQAWEVTWHNFVLAVNFCFFHDCLLIWCLKCFPTVVSREVKAPSCSVLLAFFSNGWLIIGMWKLIDVFFYCTLGWVIHYEA